MKNFFKKLAFVLALAMVVTAIAPAAQASAAAQPTLNATSKKIYIDGDYTGKYSDTFTLKVWNKGDYRVTFASSDTKIATVTKWYGVVTAKAVGTATITATVSNKTTGKVVKTLSSKVYVKKNADSVAFGSLAKFDQPLVVGDKVKINVARKAGTVTAWKQADKTQITDYTLWTSSNPEVATVDKWGTVKAIAAGETTISAVAMQTEGTVATTAPATVKVTVVGKGITDVVQTTENVVKVTFGTAQDTDKVTKDTLTITPANASVVNPTVKSISWNTEKTVATVTSYINFEDKAVYTVAVKDTDNQKEFVASVGEVASITITGPSKAVVYQSEEIKYVLKDANGIEVSAPTNARVEFEIVDNENYGYEVDGKLTLTEKGKTVVLKATYYTGKYTDEGIETSFTSNAYSVVGIDLTDLAVAKNKFTISTDSTIDWDKYTENLQVELDNYDYKLHVYAEDASGTKYNTNTDYAKFEFESLDRTVLEVKNNGEIDPIAKGIAYIKVTVVDIDKSFVIKVTVGAKSEVKSFAFDVYSKTVSTLGSDVDDTAVFKATLKNQYNGTVDVNFSTDNVVIVGLDDKSEAVKGHFDLSVKNKLSFDPNGVVAEDTYRFKVTYNDKLTRNISVVVKAPSTTDVTKLTYKLEVSSNSIDVAVNNDNAKSKDLEINYYGYAPNGIKADKVELSDSAANIEVKAPNGVVVTGSSINGTYTINVNTVSNQAITKVLKEKHGVGTYRVTVTTKVNNKDVTRVTNVILRDTQIAPVVSQKALTVSASKTIKDAFSVKTSNTSKEVEIVGYNYRTIGNTSSTSSNTTALPGVGTYVITGIIVKENLDNGNSFTHTVSVSNHLTVN